MALIYNRTGKGVYSKTPTSEKQSNSIDLKRSSSSSSSSSTPSAPLTRSDVVDLAKDQGILDSEGRIRPGKTGAWQELQKTYRDAKGVENLQAKGMATPGVQATGSDRETTMQTLRNSAQRTAEITSQGKALRGDYSETSVTVNSKALMDKTPVNNSGQVYNAYLRSRYGLNTPSNFQEQVSFLRQPTMMDRQPTQTATVTNKTKTFGDISPMKAVGKVIQKVGSFGYKAGPELNLTSFSMADSGFALISPAGGGQLVGAAARVGNTGRLANVIETTARTIYTAGGAAARYNLIAKAPPMVAGFINPSFKEVYNSPEYKDALKKAKDAEIQASGSQTMNFFGRDVPFVKGIVEQIPFVSLNRKVFETTLTTELQKNNKDLTRDQIARAAGLQVFSEDVGFTSAAVWIESQSELFGRTGVYRGAKQGGITGAIGTTGAEAAIKNLVRPSLRRAGVVEGFSSSVLYDARQGQEINPFRAVVSGAAGGFIAGELGSFIAKKRITNKGLSYATEGVADIIDLPELPGDITANIQTASLKSGLRKGNINLFPGIGYDDIVPGNIRIASVKTPSFSIFGIGAAPNQAPNFGGASFTPGNSFSTTPTSSKTPINIKMPGVTVPSNFNFINNNPSFTTSMQSFIPSPLPTPSNTNTFVPITSNIFIPSPSNTPTSTEINIDVPASVPNIINSNINIPVNVRDKFPFIPLFGGGGGSSKYKSNKGGVKGSTKTIFQSIFSGGNFKGLTVKKEKEMSGLLLRG